VGQWAAQANRPAGSVQGCMAGKAALTGPTWEKTKKKGSGQEKATFRAEFEEVNKKGYRFGFQILVQKFGFN
jgi:hypothetical protein